MLQGSLIVGSLEAIAFHSESDLSLARVILPKAGVVLAYAAIAGFVDMSGLTCPGPVILNGASAKGDIDLTGANVDGELDANRLQVGGSLLMRSDDENNASFKKVMLKSAKVTEHIVMRGASIDGDLDADSLEIGGSLLMDSDDKHKASFKKVILNGAKITNQVSLAGATIDGDLDADLFQVGGNVNLDGASVSGDLLADSLQVGGSLLMASDDENQANFHNIRLHGAKVRGQIGMVGATVDVILDADSLEVGQSVIMRSDEKNETSFNDVTLSGAKIAGQIDMTGVSIDGDFVCDFLQVGASLLMRSDNDNKASFNNIRLSSATVAGQIDMTGASIDGDLDFESLQVGDTLFMRSGGENMASFNTVNLVHATVKGGFIMDGAVLTGDFIAQGLRAAGDVSMKQIATDSPLTMSFARIDGNLDLGGANLAVLDLRGASISGEMRLGDKDKTSMVGWLAPKGGTDFIDLRDAHIGSLSDNKYSWPKHLFLDGFAFARLGGYGGDSGDEMVGRGAEWWDRYWARLDNDFTLSPYEQLAGAFTAVGARDAAEDIHYLEQARSDENSSGWASFVWSHLLRWGAGHGIGTYMFLALYWAIGLSFLGAMFLRFWANKGVIQRKHGFIWCFGASVNRLLPVLSLKKEFVDFFDDPKLNHFKPSQDFVFVALAVLGWVLGAIVIAAFASITHG